MSDNKDHIPTTNEEEPEEKKGSGGLLAPLADPVGRSTSSSSSSSSLKITRLTSSSGKALNTGLRPIGAPLEKVTGPLGNAVGGTTRGALGPLLGEHEERSELLGGNNKDSYESKPEKIAGKEQTGQNPLGLDQTGRWGFQDDEKK
jgi:hypothetical protein